MANLDFTAAEINKLLDGRYNNFNQSIRGNNTITIAANTEVLFVNNGAVSNNISAPAYITSRSIKLPLSCNL